MLDDDALVPHPELTAHEVEACDSLRHIRWVLSVEQALGIKLRSRGSRTSASW